ncbi:MAG TPA: TGS domain-containing protein [Candidatus Kapabacteria bacterium]|nr:TGS domain-containing protein [Candidatus Kapabacteria bacterium]
MEKDELSKLLNSLGANIYTPELIDFSNSLFSEVSALKLDDESKISAYFLKADISNINIKSLIESNFSNKIIENILLLNRISKVSLSGSKKNTSDLRKLFLELTDDFAIIFIKLAERLVNLRYADLRKDENLYNLSEEALYFYSPIAQQLGIRLIYHELEDISFRNLFPDDFKYLESMIEKKMHFYQSKLNTMKADLLKMMNKFNIHCKFQQRVKRPYSIYRKLVKQKIPLEKIFDLLALRVIPNTVEECYLALGAVHSQWIPIEGRFRDWISFPKSNGYRSIQTTVATRTGDKFEIQIRTEEMHQEAEYGSSAHWSYKQGGKSTQQDWVNRLREFLENDEYFDNPYLAFDKLKQEMKRDYINVLTPKGEIRPLPEGSTTLDYAFDVHTDLGYKTTGARVNGKFVKLNTILKSGDVIDIISNNSATPSRDWINIVKTNRAKTKILRWFKKNEQDLLINDGRNTWEKLKNKYKKRLIGNDDEQKAKNNINKLGFKSLDDFFYAIASGGVKCTLFTLKKVYPDAFKKTDNDKKEAKYSAGKHSIPQVRVEGLSNITTVLSKCCNPIKGEPIVAYITKKSDIKIHSKNCQYIKNLGLPQDNFKPAEWYGESTTQQINIRVLGFSYSKVLTAFVEEADDNSIKIIDTNKIKLRNLEGISAELLVKDYSQLNKFMNKLRNSQHIEEVK